METNQHWRSKAHYIKADTFEELCTKLSDYAKDKFVVAWQIFTNPQLTNLHCIVTWKELDI